MDDSEGEYYRAGNLKSSGIHVDSSENKVSTKTLHENQEFLNS